MTSPLVSRSAAGLRPPRSTPAAINAVHLTVHYGGPSPWRGGTPDHTRCASIWRAWQAFHMDARGWSDIAYSSGVCPHGTRYEGRGPGRRTAANGTEAGNRQSLATCYIAGDGDPLTDAAKHAFRDEAERFGVPLDRAHSDWKPTGCPGDPLRAWIRAGAPRPGGPPPTPPVEDIMATLQELEQVVRKVVADEHAKSRSWIRDELTRNTRVLTREIRQVADRILDALGR